MEIRIGKDANNAPLWSATPVSTTRKVNICPQLLVPAVIHPILTRAFSIGFAAQYLKELFSTG